jgi:hypothetical protein
MLFILASLLFMACATMSLTGCGSSSNTVVRTPALSGTVTVADGEACTSLAVIDSASGAKLSLPAQCVPMPDLHPGAMASTVAWSMRMSGDTGVALALELTNEATGAKIQVPEVYFRLPVLGVVTDSAPSDSLRAEALPLIHYPADSIRVAFRRKPGFTLEDHPEYALVGPGYHIYNEGTASLDGVVPIYFARPEGMYLDTSYMRTHPNWRLTLDSLRPDDRSSA